MRNEFINELISAGAKHPNLVVLDADCSRSTKSTQFKDIYPERFFNLGICEQNMVGVSAGLSRMGYLPVINAFSAMLTGRAAEQIIQSICLPNLPVKIIGHYSGISASLEGAPHHALFDIAFLRGIPNMAVYSPSTQDEISEVLEDSLQSNQPSYIRLSRNPIQKVEMSLQIKKDNWNLYQEIDGEVLFIAIGPSVQECIKTTNYLKSKGIKAGVLSMKKLTSVDSNDFINILKNYNTIVTVEEHSIIGGLASLVSEIMVEKNIQKQLIKIGFSSFTETGEYNWLLQEYGLSHMEILNTLLAKTNLSVPI